MNCTFCFKKLNRLITYDGYVYSCHCILNKTFYISKYFSHNMIDYQIPFMHNNSFYTIIYSIITNKTCLQNNLNISILSIDKCYPINIDLLIYPQIIEIYRKLQQFIIFK